jgi:signal transduction protein with GAF and PtsI domain
MAGDPQSAVLLVGMGINALSMASSCIRRVKLAVGKFTRGQARFLARAAISAEDTQEVREILSGAFANVGLGNVISGHDPSNGITLADGVV